MKFGPFHSWVFYLGKDCLKVLQFDFFHLNVSGFLDRIVSPPHSVIFLLMSLFRCDCPVRLSFILCVRNTIWYTKAAVTERPFPSHTYGIAESRRRTALVWQSPGL